MATFIQDSVGPEDMASPDAIETAQDDGRSVAVQAVHTGTDEMSQVSLWLLTMFGAMDDMLDFASGYFLGMASLVSAIPSTGQVLVVIFDPNLRKQAAGQATKLIMKRGAVVVAIWLVEGIPVLNLLPLQTCVALILKHLKSSQRRLASEHILPNVR